MKAHYDMLDFVANAQQGIPKLCPCGSVTKEFIDEDDTYDYLPGKRYFVCKDYQNDGLHFWQPWVMGVQEEVERIKLRVHEHENPLRECETLKSHVRMLLMRVFELEKKSISLPQDPKAVLFAKVQEATRKDVERGFGVLQA